MKRIFFYSLVALAFLMPGKVYTQVANPGFDEVYGLDPKLYNGEVYSYFLAPDTKGNQYLIGPDFIEGSVRIKGITYSHLVLNLDIFNQQLLLKYDFPQGTNHILIISKAWLEGFSLGMTNFELIRYQDTAQRIFQVTGNGKIRLLTSWSKEQKIDYYYTAPYYVFSSPKKALYLQMNSGIISFKNNKSFVSAFDIPRQGAIRKYLRQNKINTKNASDASMLELINFCNTL